MASPLATLPSDELLARLRALVRRDNALEADLLAHLGEVDGRRLYLEQACSSMFTYCVRVLHFSEAAAYKRIASARAARRHPELLEAVRRGDLHVTAASLLAAQLSAANCAELIDLARHRTADEIRRRAGRPTATTGRANLGASDLSADADLRPRPRRPIRHPIRKGAPSEEAIDGGSRGGALSQQTLRRAPQRPLQSRCPRLPRRTVAPGQSPSAASATACASPPTGRRSRSFGSSRR